MGALGVKDVWFSRMPEVDPAVSGATLPKEDL